MIIRSSLECKTCGQSHTVRIGMGQEEYQSHQFACGGCGEDIRIALHVDYKNISSRVEIIENAIASDEVKGAVIVNLDPNFIVPESERNADFAFPRLRQMHAMMEAAQKKGLDLDSIPAADIRKQYRPHRRPDYADEWRLLKKAWGLHRRNKTEIVERQISDASAQFYSNDPLKGLPDWVWRFSLFVSEGSHGPRLKAAFEEIRPLLSTDGFKRFLDDYELAAADRGERYRDILNEYFSNFSEFGQVFFLMRGGMPIPDGNVISSNSFNNIRMFYGNAFELFSSHVDILAYFNNLKNGRPFDEFERLTRKQYLDLDKSGRFNAFANNIAFTSLCEERDNQIRNASHHGSIRLNAETQNLVMKAGKGGQGESVEISYASYLEKSTNIAMQIIVLLRIELLISSVRSSRPPV